MKVELKNKEKNTAVFTVEVSPETFEKAIESAYNKTKGHFNIHGFRKGKAPRKLIENAYGKDVFYEEAINISLNEVYGPALDELDLKPIDYPKVNLVDSVEENKPFTVEFTVTTKPEAVLGDYKKLEVDYVPITFKDEMVDREIEKQREKNARLINVEDRPVEDGDTVNIDFEGFVDSVAFEGGKGEGYDLVIGSNTFVPGFESSIIGKEIGQEFDVEVTFPEDYQEDLKGKEAVFKTKLNSIKKKELPELDDDFAMDVSEFDTFKEYKDSITEASKKQVEDQNKNIRINKAVEALIGVMDVEIPEVMFENQLEQELANFESRISQMGIDLDTYYRISGSNLDQVKDELRPQAEAQTKSKLALEAFIKAENLEVTEEEIDEELRELAKSYNSDDVESFVKNYKESEILDQLKDFIMNRKSLDRLEELVTFKEVAKKEETEEK